MAYMRWSGRVRISQPIFVRSSASLWQRWCWFHCSVRWGPLWRHWPGRWPMRCRGCGVLLVLTSKQPLRIDLLLAGSMGLLLALIGVSFVWADDPGMCLRRMFALFCCVVAAIGVARAFSLRELCWLALWTLGALTV